MNGPVDVRASIARQELSKAALRIFPHAPRKPRKALKQADVDAAVNETLDMLDRDFRRLGVEFPKFKQAYDTARVAIQNARRKA